MKVGSCLIRVFLPVDKLKKRAKNQLQKAAIDQSSVVRQNPTKHKRNDLISSPTPPYRCLVC